MGATSKRKQRRDDTTMVVPEVLHNLCPQPPLNAPNMLKIVFLILLGLSDTLRVRTLGVNGLRIQKTCFLIPKRQSLTAVPSSPVQRGKSLRAAAPKHSHLFGRALPEAKIPTSLRGGAAVIASTVGVPPLRLWIGPALLCALSYALYNIFIKKASASIDPMLGGVLLQIVAALLGTLLLVAKRATGQSVGGVPTQAEGIKWAVLAGVAVGAAEILSFLISSMGVQAMQSIPIVVGGSVLFGTVLGTVWLKEVLTIKGWCGVVLIAAGITLLGMDPGSTGIH